MDSVQEILFGEYPRFVANPVQWACFDEGSFDMFLDANEGEANCYSRISWYARDGGIMLDEVFLDLDSEFKINGMSETEMVDRLFSDGQFRQDLLGGVVKDVRSVAKFCREESIPLIGVYTGKGVHLHALFESRREPVQELKSRQDWFVEECNLSTFDGQVRGDIKRLCRVPNCRRYDDELEQPTKLYTVPLSHNELLDVTVDELVDFSVSPRIIPIPGESRPPFLSVPDYDGGGAVEMVEVEQKATGEFGEVSEKMEAWLQDVLQLPCMYERIQTRNPAHSVRLNCAVLMFNVGMTVEEVLTVFKQLGWRDFDEQVSRKHLRQIKRKGYVPMSCAKIQASGLCVFDQGSRVEKCEQFGFRGGESEF